MAESPKADSGEDGRRPCLFLNHIHTVHSNRFMAEVSDTWNYGDNNHCTDIPGIIDALPDGFDIVFNVAGHWRTDERVIEELQDRLETFADDIERYERHLYLEAGDNRAAVMKSFEPSVRHDNYHFLVNGVPLDYEVDAQRCISLDKLLSFGDDAAWIAPAHTFAPNFKIPDRLLHVFFARAKEEKIQTALGYTAGYTPLLNDLTHGRFKRCHNAIDAIVNPETRFSRLFDSCAARNTYDLMEYSRQYDVPIVPEADLHTVLPDRMQGAGLCRDNSVMDRFAAGSFPVQSLLHSTDIIQRPGRRGVSWKEFFQSFPGIVPLYKKEWFRGVLPYELDEFEQIRDRSYLSLDAMDASEIQRHAFPPGQLL